jgi:hypothetical protein
MVKEVFFNTNKYIIVVSAIESIAKLKDGKSDVGVFVSFYSDYNVWF